jgi:hypothetical protein
LPKTTTNLQLAVISTAAASAALPMVGSISKPLLVVCGVVVLLFSACKNSGNRTNGTIEFSHRLVRLFSLASALCGLRHGFAAVRGFIQLLQAGHRTHGAGNSSLAASRPDYQDPYRRVCMGGRSSEYNRLERSQSPVRFDIAGNGNPHQAYLLWGVQLGIPGLVLFCTLLFSSLRDSLSMANPHASFMRSAALARSLADTFIASIYDALIGDFVFLLLGLLLAFGSARMTSPGQHGMPA